MILPSTRECNRGTGKLTLNMDYILFKCKDITLPVKKTIGPFIHDTHSLCNRPGKSLEQ